MKRCVMGCFAFLISMLLVCLSGCGKREVPLVRFLSYSDMHFDSDFQDGGVVCENEKWRLYWDDSNQRVSFEEKATGAVWGQIPAEAAAPVYQENGAVKKNHPQLESVLQVIYQDPKSFDDVTAYSYSGAVQSGGVYAEKIENGLRVTYEFIENEFSVPVEYTIGDGSFEITVDPTRISEGEDYKIHSIAIAPFLCGMKNDAENSWFFMPDGAGTVMRPFVSDGVGTIGQKYVYGKDMAFQTYVRSVPEEQVHMPVFGVKKGDNALFAVITSGAEAASLNWNIGSANIGYSGIYPKFRIRGFSYIERPENFVTTTTLGAFKIFSDGIVTTPLKIEYFPLSGERADIYGMADCYRRYLTERAGLDRNAGDEKLATIKYVGAVMQPAFILGLPTEKLFPLSTTGQVLTMTEELAASVGNDIHVNLVGFGETGLDCGKLAGGFTVADSLGGTKGMKNLLKALREKNINAFMDFDLISFSQNGAGFDKSSAAVYHGGQVIEYTSFDTVSRAANRDRFFVLSRDHLFTAADKVLKKGEKMGLTGISYTSLSQYVYSDYGKQDYYISGKMAEDVSAIFKSAKNSGYQTLSSGANAYAAVSAEYINDVPLYSSGYIASDYDVPFYQFVFKGYRPMSSVSVNLCADKRDALLRCIESGISPSYTLYYHDANELVTSDHSFIFGSAYAGNKEEVISDVNAVKAYLNSVEGASVSDYVRLSDTASVVKFDNGVYAVVNFGDSEILTDYGRVSAKSFLTGRESD